MVPSVIAYTSTPGERWVIHRDLRMQAGAESAGGTVIRLDRNRTLQTIEGFGAAFNEKGWEALSALPEDKREQVLDDLFKPGVGLNFTIGRTPIGASDYAMDAYSYDETPGDYGLRHFTVERDERYLLPYLRAALKRQPQLYIWASPWSPPAWMKANNRYDCVGDPQKAHLIFDAKTQAAYAHYFARYIEAYRTRGVRVQALHMQNEPAQCQIFPSALWTGAQMRDFLRDYLAPTLQSEGLDTELWLGTINYADYDAYAGVVLADPKLAPQITGVGYQWDGKKAIAEAHQRHPNLRLMQTESECGNGENDAKAGFYTFSLIRHYFNGGANSYVYWNMVLDPKGPSTWGWEQNSLITVSRAARKPIYNFEYHVMRHVSGLVRPGAKLLNIEAAENALAFLNPDGAIVVVYANPADQPQELTLQQEGEELKVAVPPQSMTSWVIGAKAARSAL